ncbi:MAG: hypothetical protein GY717_00990 [Rhodobacteraceae bacterium]|nr:hypothetical protein [Paracoccaceae bacterium]
MVDTFEFSVDGSTQASKLDFNALALTGTTNGPPNTAFDDIPRFEITPGDGTAFVVDDFLITP